MVEKRISKYREAEKHIVVPTFRVKKQNILKPNPEKKIIYVNKVIELDKEIE